MLSLIQLNWFILSHFTSFSSEDITQKEGI